jgi:predicted permease
MNTFEMLIKVIPMLVAIALGYVLTRKSILKESMVDGFRQIIINVTLPASILLAFVKIRFEASYLLIIISVFAACLILLYIGKLIARIFSIKSRYFPFLLTGFESGMMGYPLYTMVFGPAATANFGVVDIGQELFIFLVFVPMVIGLKSGGKETSGMKESLKTAAKSPPVWAILLGLVCSLAGSWAYQDTVVFRTFDSILTFMSVPTAFLICLVIGSGLKLSLKNMRLELITAVLKLGLAVVFAFILRSAVFAPIGAAAPVATALFVMLVLPAPFVLPVFMRDPGKEDINFVSNTLSIGSILGVIGFIAVMLLEL